MADRVPHIDWFLAYSGQLHQIVTSTLSVAEVGFAEIESQGGCSATMSSRESMPLALR